MVVYLCGDLYKRYYTNLSTHLIQYLISNIQYCENELILSLSLGKIEKNYHLSNVTLVNLKQFKLNYGALVSLLSFIKGENIEVTTMNFILFHIYF